MKTGLARIFAVSMAAVMFALPALAQNDIISAAAGDKYVISAKAGGVNLVEGTVGVVRKNGQSGLLIKGDKVEVGDRVSTGADGKAEILLNPGSYLRLGGNSSFEFNTTSLDDLQLKLQRGSAVLEVFAADEFRVVVKAPKAVYTLIESGIFRIDVTPDGGSKIAVRKGRAHVGNSTEAVKGGREAAVVGNQLAIAKFDKDDKDSLELWSKDRAKQLARISSNLRGRDLRTSLMNSHLGSRWNIYNSFGLWVYDYSFGSYCFLPFGQGWYSPYGYGFGRSIWHYNLPRTFYYPPPNPTNTGGGSGRTIKPVDTVNDRKIPPVERMPGSRRGGRFEDRNPSIIGPGDNSAPIHSPRVITPLPPSTGDSKVRTKP